MSQALEHGVSPACRIVLEFGAGSLRERDPLPLVLEFLAGLPGLAEKRQELFLILSELFYNALDHGLLGIESSIKEEDEGFGRFYELREARRAALTEGRIRLELEHRPGAGEPGDAGGELLMVVEDSGAGFDFERELPGFDANLGSSGRGIPLLRSLCRELRYVAPGNRVEALYVW